ncbi:MAG: SusF/SusE family outer membrane protein [Bacteroidales bacterium]|nr:SusF/SusE family outer membrane protein [Bacteroidales bacterium]
MKKFRNIIWMALLSMVVLSSCEVDSASKVTLLSDPVPSVLESLTSSSFVLEKVNKDVTFQTFTWSETDFGGIDLPASYELQMALAGTDFANPIKLYKGVLNSATLTIGEFNGFLKKIKAVESQENNVELRVITTLNTDRSAIIESIPAVVSESIAITVTPYADIVVYPAMNIPGGYQGWDPTNTTTAIYDVSGTDTYQGYVYIKDNTELKFARGSWNENWGVDGTASYSGSTISGKFASGGGNISVNMGSGVYYFYMDFSSMTFIVEKTNWGIIGSATPTGWDSDTDMIYDVDKNLLKITLNFTAGEFKFRANDGWDNNYGFDPDVTDPEKALKKGGSNIPIEEGQYTIALKIFQPIPTYGIYKGTVIADYPYLNVPGAYQGWDAANMNTVIWSADSDDCYTGYLYLSDVNGFKFAYNSWTYNWGGSGDDKETNGKHSGTLSVGGGDFKGDKAGLYYLYVDLTSLTYEYLRTEWGIIGSATSGGWDTDTDMQYDTATGLLSATLNLVAGEIKFRANDGWDHNLGGTTSKLTYGGSNIVIEEAGTYEVVLNLTQKVKPVYTFTITKK